HVAGHDQLLAIVTASFSSYSGCRQYREDLAAALVQAGLDGVMRIDKVRQYFDHPGFVQPNVDAVRAGLRELTAAGVGQRAHVMFATHSIPVIAADAAGPRETRPDGSEVAIGDAGGWYAEQQRVVAQIIMQAVADEFP